jgi:broad specificity phosphatase PhoE
VARLRFLLSGRRVERRGAGSGANAIERIVDGSEGRHVVVASHGNALALFLRTLDAAVDFAFWARMTTPDVYVVDVAGARPWTYRRIWTA